MYLSKVIKTSEMSNEIFQYLLENEHIVEDGFGYWDVGAFASDAEKNPSQYVEVEEAKIIDIWLLEQGGIDGERILIEHG